MKYALAILAFLCVTGCTTKDTTTASVERRTGIENGQPVDVTTIRKEQEQTQTQVDMGPVVQAAVAAATGDIRGAIKSLAERPAPSANEVANLVSSMLPKQAGADDIAKQVAAMLPAQDPKVTGIDGTTGTLGGAAGGLALLALQQYLAKRKSDADAEEEWKRANEAHAREVELAKQLPPPAKV